MKKNKTLFIAGICILAVIVLAAISIKMTGRRPFKHLVETDIASASVSLSPPDKTIVIAEFEELVNYLNDVVIYSKDNSYTEYAGQGVTFNIVMSDGTQIDVMAYNPFFVMDGVGYKTKYEPCEALNAYANKLLRGNDD